MYFYDDKQIPIAKKSNAFCRDEKKLEIKKYRVIL